MRRLLLLLLVTLASCDVLLPRHLPRPPRRHLTIEKAQRYNQRMNTPEMRNRRYYRAYPHK